MDTSKIIKLIIASIIAILLVGAIFYVNFQRKQIPQNEVVITSEQSKVVQQQIEELDRIRETSVDSQIAPDSGVQIKELDDLGKKAGSNPPIQQEIDEQIKSLDALRSQ
jgi:hypothetical protein